MTRFSVYCLMSSAFNHPTRCVFQNPNPARVTTRQPINTPRPLSACSHTHANTCLCAFGSTGRGRSGSTGRGRSVNILLHRVWWCLRVSQSIITDLQAGRYSKLCSFISSLTRRRVCVTYTIQAWNSPTKKTMIISFFNIVKHIIS